MKQTEKRFKKEKVGLQVDKVQVDLSSNGLIKQLAPQSHGTVAVVNSQ